MIEGRGYLGLDIGSVNARAAVVADDGQVIYLDAERISKGPSAALRALFERLRERVPLESLAGTAVTGSGRRIYGGCEGWQLVGSPFAAITGLRSDGADPGTVVAMGGQTSLVISLPRGSEEGWRVARSPLCAAGTGRFLEQQASRLGIPIEAFGATALEWKEAPPRIAARCSVFAKSDLIHLQQKGWPISAMLAGLSDSVARMIVAQWKDGFDPPVYCIGGVAANQGVIRALSAALGGLEVIVPPHHAGREAIGAALLARRAPSRPIDLLPPADRDQQLFSVPRRLESCCSADGWRPAELGPLMVDVALGVDVGSTSTKAAIIDPEGRVLAKSYLMTAGQPLEAIKQVMANLVPMVEGRVRVRAAGVTGSGRYLVGSFIGADLIKNEITAQTRAALQIDPQVNTIFELGGQDSKYVYLENGTVLDYQMNKACAAGTGSFIDELSEQLGISTRTGEFAGLAFAADSQLDLGEKCTAFMSQAVTSAQHSGVGLGVIVSSLSTSLAKNYRSKVVGTRRVGDRIFLTGAVFYNDAAVSAFKAEFPGKTLVVPQHKEVTGAIGAALLALEAMPEGAESSFKGFGPIARASYRLTNFTCHRCENSCAISSMVTDGGARLFYGSRCDLFDSKGRGGGVAGPQGNVSASPPGRGRPSEARAGEGGGDAPERSALTPTLSQWEREHLAVGAQDRAGETPALPAGLSTQNPAPGTQNPEPRTQNPEPGTRERAGETPALPAGLSTQHPAPRTQNPELRTQNPEPGTRERAGETPALPAGRRTPNHPTPFDQREGLLLAGYDPAGGTGPVVGVPRALMAMDLAPMLTGFLNSLGVRIRYSSPTNQKVIEKSLELAYTDSCFPIKLLHGHVAELVEQGAQYILIPNAIRMGGKAGDEDQRYACPLVQAAPYIVRSVFGLGDRLLDPIIDFSRGDQLVIRSFAEIARRLGFSPEKGAEAARRALAQQRRFDAELAAAGQKLLQRLEADPSSIGVVMMARAYNAQDAGANLGMAQELSKLGVVPVPLDYLPLDRVDVRDISDRPYWNYERKLLAAAKLVAEQPQLFGLFLSNFGCGPNSIIQNIVEDIMGGKPLGQIELDEHAAEAGYITRLEAMVDTVKGYRRAGLQRAGSPEKYARRVPSSVRAGQKLLIARMSDHAEVVAAAMRAFGVNARVLPESDERSMALSRDVTNGKECLPFRDTLGVFLRMAEEGSMPRGARALMAGSFGPCRLGKYAQEQQKILDERGIELKIMTTVSNNAYSDLGLGARFELLAWQGVVATDLLQRLLWSTRPYEAHRGETDRAYHHYVAQTVSSLESRRPLEPLLREAAATFGELRDRALPKRPRVGINGEIYLRANRFCNQDLVLLCEANGLEVEVAPMSEWLKYTTVRNLEDALVNREVGRILKGAVRKLATGYYEGRVSSWFDPLIPEREPATEELLAASRRYLPSRNGSEAILSLGSGVRQMADPHFAGVISVMPHGCMPGGIVAALAPQISREYGHKPWISLTFDGFTDKVNPERIADLAEQLRHRAEG